MYLAYQTIIQEKVETESSVWMSGGGGGGREEGEGVGGEGEGGGDRLQQYLDVWVSPELSDPVEETLSALSLLARLFGVNSLVTAAEAVEEEEDELLLGRVGVDSIELLLLQ